MIKNRHCLFTFPGGWRVKYCFEDCVCVITVYGDAVSITIFLLNFNFHSSLPHQHYDKIHDKERKKQEETAIEKK